MIVDRLHVEIIAVRCNALSIFKGVHNVLTSLPFIDGLVSLWGQTRHRITGELAQSSINGKTASELEMILGKQGLAEMTTWPDEQRFNPQPFWQKDANPWHYVTLQAGQQPGEPVSPAEGDALTALERFAATVRDPAA